MSPLMIIDVCSDDDDNTSSAKQIEPEASTQLRCSRISTLSEGRLQSTKEHLANREQTEEAKALLEPLPMKRASSEEPSRSNRQHTSKKRALSAPSSYINGHKIPMSNETAMQNMFGAASKDMKPPTGGLITKESSMSHHAAESAQQKPVTSKALHSPLAVTAMIDLTQDESSTIADRPPPPRRQVIRSTANTTTRPSSSKRSKQFGSRQYPTGSLPLPPRQPMIKKPPKTYNTPTAIQDTAFLPSPTPPADDPPRTTTTIKPKTRPWTAAQIASLADSLQAGFDFENFAESNGKSRQEVMDVFSAVVQMPLLGFSERGAERARKMREFRAAVKDYKDGKKKISGMRDKGAKRESEEASAVKKRRKRRTRAEMEADDLAGRRVVESTQSKVAMKPGIMETAVRSDEVGGGGGPITGNENVESVG